MTYEKRSIILYADGHGVMTISGDIAQTDHESKELLKQGRITKELYDAIQIHLHYWREAIAGKNPPRPYWKMSKLQGENNE